MKILVTGAEGFIGKNLTQALKNQNHEALLFDKSDTVEALDAYCAVAEFVFHLAGVNRPENPNEFMEGNFGLTSLVLESLKKHQNVCPIMISSSTQAALDNPYGESKRAGEDLLFKYSIETGARVLVYRFPNVFGKWSRPNYNSAIATFCHNVAHDLPIVVNDPSVVMNLVHVDDVVDELIGALENDGSAMVQQSLNNCFYAVQPVYRIKLGEVVDFIYSFKRSREDRSIPEMSDPFIKKLYATYLSFLPVDQFSYPLKMNSDQRGSFTEFIKTPDRGQVSVNISKPGITKGNHWHHTKNEKFLVVSGRGVIRFRKIDTKDIIEYNVNSDCLQVVDIPPGYTHNIENLGETDMVTIMWASEAFDSERPDTIFEQV